MQTDGITILSIITGVSGVIIALMTAKTSATKTQFDTLEQTIKMIQTENTRLRGRVDELEKENAELRKEIDELRSQRPDRTGMRTRRTD